MGWLQHHHLCITEHPHPPNNHNQTESEPYLKLSPRRVNVENATCLPKSLALPSPANGATTRFSRPSEALGSFRTGLRFRLRLYTLNLAVFKPRKGDLARSSQMVYAPVSPGRPGGYCVNKSEPKKRIKNKTCLGFPYPKSLYKELPGMTRSVSSWNDASDWTQTCPLQGLPGTALLSPLWSTELPPWQLLLRNRKTPIFTLASLLVQK